MQNKSYHVSQSQSDFSRITTEPPLNADLHFLITCCQTNLSKEDIEFIHSYLNAERLELNALIGLANQHGILPLVYKTIKKLSEDSFLHDTKPSTNHVSPITYHEILSAFKQQYLLIAQRNILMSAELIRIIQLLEKNSIETLAFKGPTLSQMAYGDITLRQYVDLDVLVKKEDIYKIDALLKDRGYQRFLEITPVQEQVYMQYAHDLGLYHPKSGVHFEMHWSLMDEDYPMQIDLDAIWEDPQTVKINQQEIRTFPTEELLLYLCIHGSKHLWERIEWIKDIDLMIRTQDIDWEKVIKEAESSRFETMFYLGLSLTMQLFETPLPENITKHISAMKVLQPLSIFILQNWQTPKTAFQKTAAMLKLFPGLKERLIYLNKILIKPSFNEYWYIDFPKGFYWLYYFLRPYLLIKKYFSTTS
ncbi:nucleotidyltransferase family protein [Sulfurovum sp. CS9]|uniref:nucleotidyltransferase domain-containing protein n=1 Tax=Sulfurovum sp. CS9 TaxID=3391146 RepID=UPI0039EBBD4B